MNDKYTVSELIVFYLKKHDIQKVFGIIGSANSQIFEAIRKDGSIQIVPVHHEQVAVMAMGAYYRATGKLSCALVTAGGGSANSFTGILSNWADSIPGIIISGQEQSYYIDEYKDMRMYGVQGYDSAGMFNGKCTKFSKVLTAENANHTLNMAFKETVDGRPGPIFLEVPFDVQGHIVTNISDNDSIQTTSDDVFINFTNSTDNFLASKVILDHLTKDDTRKVVVIGGHGIKLSDSKKEFIEFIREFNIPTLLTWSAIDLLPSDDSLYYGRPGVQGHRSANKILQSADLIIVLGSRLSLLQTGYDRSLFAKSSTIIHIDIDSSEQNKQFPNSNLVRMNLNVKPILSNLCSSDTSSKDIVRNKLKDWIRECNSFREMYDVLMPEHIEHNQQIKSKNLVNSYVFIDELSKLIPSDYTIVTDMGTALLSGFYGWNIKEGQTMFTSLGLGEMGYGLAAAVGAGFGDKPVMCLNCDGGMMMNLQELQTIVSNNLPVKIVIFNNDGYLMIKHTQKMMFGDGRIAVDSNTGLTLPDYHKVADCFGFKYFTHNELEDFVSYDGRAIIEVFMDPEQEFIPKVRGRKNDDGTIVPGTLENMYPYSNN